MPIIRGSIQRLAVIAFFLAPFIVALPTGSGMQSESESEIANRIAFAVYGTPEIDGSADEVWGLAPSFETDRPVKSLNDPQIALPARASVRCLWDERHLYVLALVADSKVQTVNEVAWEQDSIEIFLDGNHDRTGPYQADDGQFRVSARGNVTYGGVGLQENVRAKTVATDNGYAIEMAIRLNGLQPELGSLLGLEVQVNGDEGLGRRQTLMKWNSPTDRSWRDTSCFGTLLLSSKQRLAADIKSYEETHQSEMATRVPDRVEPSAESLTRVPDWASEAIFYQIFPERFRNGDPTNDPTRESLEDPNGVPASWATSPWTGEWYSRAPWEKQLGGDFYENGVFNRRYGGDLQGVIDKLDYLHELGINVIYFNPVFYARSLHKYDGNSFHHIDPHFGPNPAGDFALMATETADPGTWKWTAADKLFVSLVQQAHARKIRVIIDGVFNHTGRDFFAFADIVKRGRESTYLDWYSVEQFDDPATAENELKYKCWWGVDTLPEFSDNESGTDLHPKPRNYIFQATRRWMDPNGDGNPDDGIDGWRLDVANEVPNKFWQDWNRLVREINPAAFTVAEIWEDAGDYLGDCGFSSTMNYHGFAYPVKGFLIDARLSATDFASQLTTRMEKHPRAVQFALQNMLDSHDTDRLASMIVNARHQRPYHNAERHDYDVGERVSPRRFVDYDVNRPDADHQRLQRLVALFQLTFVGAPMIYYGTESGMDGADDPDDRMPMVWDDLIYQPRKLGPKGPLTRSSEVEFDRDLHAFYRSLISLRKSHPALNHGEINFLVTHDGDQSVVFTRSFENQTMVVALNRGDETCTVDLDLSHLHAAVGNLRLQQVFTSTGEDAEEVTTNGNRATLKLPGKFGAVWLVNGIGQE